MHRGASSALSRSGVLPVLLAAVLCAAAPIRAQTPDPGLEGLEGLERARVLAELTLRDRDQDAAAALAWGREALAILERVPEPRIRVDVTAEMAWAEMVLGNYDEAVRLGQAAREEAAAAGYPQGEARAINSLGVIARRRGDAATTLVHFVETLALRRAADDSAGIAMALNNLGFVYSTDLGDFDRSLEHHLEAMRIRERLGRPADLALSLNDIGVLYQSLGELDQAQEYLERALELRREHDIPLRVAGTLSNLGEVMLARDDAAGALGHFRTAMAIRQDAGEPTSIAASHLHIGQALTRLGRLGEAEASLQRALAMAEELGETRSLARIHQALGQLEFRSGRHDLAEHHLLRAAGLADGMGARHLVAEMYDMLADVREASGDAAGALQAHRRFKAAADEVLDEDKARRFASLEARYQAERREREIEALRHDQTVRELELARQRLLRDLMALAGGGLVVLGVLFQRRRASSAREVNRRLEVMARTDPLTGLDNRRAFVEKAEEERARMQRSGRPASVILGDVDHFKVFNDRHGHAVGDEVLRHVARLLADAVREQDTVARWGGEEFVFLLPETSAEGAAVVAEKLRTTISGAPTEAGDAVVSLTMTFGVAAARPDASVDAWILAADEALYEGKAAGRDRVEVGRRATRAPLGGALLLALMAGSVPGAAQEALRPHAPDSLAAADYARAESFLAAAAGPRVTGSVDGVTWLPDGRFWYRTTRPDGPRVYIVDPAARERRALLDPVRLADALSAAAAGHRGAALLGAALPKSHRHNPTARALGGRLARLP
ncbi:MAG: diguanylate cyclase, partial [Gemmatimonadetes bacterium]|nr:diguanylate cyclase [Gemmatimonadota bacterium]